MTGIEVSVLGNLELKVDGVVVPVSPGKAALVAALALVHPQSADHNRLAPLIWSDQPTNTRKAIQNQVKRLRSDFGADIIITAGNSYRLGEHVTIADRELFLGIPTSTTARSALRNQLQLWRGEPYANLAAASEVWIERDLLESHRQVLLDQLDVRPHPIGPHDDEQPPNRTLVLSRDQEALVEHLTNFAGATRVANRSQAIVIAGSAGSGKTTLIDAFAAEQPRGWVAVRAACSESPAAAHETVARLLSSLPSDSPPDPDLRIMDRFIAALTAIERRVVVIVDDFQWATLALCELLERIAREAPGALVVLGTRDRAAAVEVLQSFEVADFEPPTLDETALGRLVRAAISRESDATDVDVDEVSAEVHFLTGGVALFSVRLIEELGAANAFVETGGTWALRDDYPVPRSLAEAVASQHMTLPMRARHFVELVATLHMIGGSSSTQYLQGHDTAATQEAERSGLVADQDQGVWVMHAEVARAIGESLSDGSKAELHALAADLLRESAPIGAARHAMRAPTLPFHIVSNLIETAGSVAYEHADYATAVEMQRTALERAKIAARPLEELIDLTTQLCDAARRAGDKGQLTIMLDLIDLVQASRDVERMAMAVRVICKLGASSDVEPRPEFVEFVEHTLSQDLSPASRATVLAASTQLYAISRYPLVRGRFIEAYELAKRVGDGALTGFILPGAYMSLADPEDLALRTTIGMELLRHAALEDDPTATWEAHHLLWSCAVIRGDGARMAHHLQSAIDLPGTRAEPVKEATVAYMQAAAACLEGDLVLAEEQADRFLTLSGAVGPQRVMAVYGALITAIRREQGRLAEVVPMVERLYADQPMVVAWKGVLAMLFAETGELERADVLVTELLADGLDAVPRGITHSAVIYSIADAAASVGNALRCQQLLELLQPFRGTMAFSGTFSLGSMDLIMGRLAVAARQHDEALILLDAAEIIGQSNNWPAVEMRAQLARTQIHPDGPEAHQVLRTTFARATQLKLTGVAKRARQLSRG